MPKYFVDSESSIEELFDRESDALNRAGFHQPKFAEQPEDYISARVDEEATSVELPSPIDEAAKLGVDVEKYLEG